MAGAYEGALGGASARKRQPSLLALRWLRKGLASDYLALLIFLAGLIVVFWQQSPFFLDYNNFVNILTAITVSGIIAVPATMLIVAGQIDLSVGAGVAFCGVVFARVASENSLWLALLITIFAGITIGAVNGILVTVVGVNSLIATLGALAFLSGGAKLVAGGQTILVSGFDLLGRSRPFANIPLSVLIFVAVLLAGSVVMRYTVMGRQLYAIGGNASAARLVGVRSGWLVFGMFVLSGAAIALSSLIQTSQLGAGSPITAVGLELSVITAVVLGGTSLSGGRGTIFGTLLGLLIVGVLSNGLTLLNVDPFWQDIVRGALLILAVSFDQVRLRIRHRRRSRPQAMRPNDTGSLQDQSPPIDAETMPEVSQ